jgi:hypothetical protein
MKRAVYLIGFLASFTLSTGFIFKIMHWPGASILMLTGFLMLNIGFLPLYFYDKYKSAKA